MPTNRSIASGSRVTSDRGQDLLGELLQVELARGANEAHRVVHHRYAPGFEHLAEDDAQSAGPRPLLQIVDRLVAQEYCIQLVHGDPFGIARLDAVHEALERVVSVKVRSMSPAHELPVALPQLDVPDSDVRNLVAGLGRGPRQPRRRVLVHLGRDVIDKEGKSHADAAPS